MRVVINDCFGGFGLSHAAVMKYAELAGIKLQAFVHDTNGKDYMKMIPYKHPDHHGFVIHYSQNPEALDEKGRIKNDGYWYDHDLMRNDPLLVQVVEELGDKANGSCASLKIIEIPDDVAWVITEYDGNETVEEEHRSWS